MRVAELFEEQLDEGMFMNLLAAVAMLVSSPHLLSDKSIDTSHSTTPTYVKTTHVKHDDRQTFVNTAVERVAKKYKVDPKVAKQIAQTAVKHSYKDFPTAKDLLGVIGTESSFNPKAVSKLKHDPARGLMQIRPGVWGMDPEELNTIDDQIRIGAKILRAYYEKLGSREAALHAYNVGITNYKTGRVQNPQYVTKVNYNKAQFEDQA